MNPLPWPLLRPMSGAEIGHPSLTGMEKEHDPCSRCGVKLSGRGVGQECGHRGFDARASEEVGVRAGP